MPINIIKEKIHTCIHTYIHAYIHTYIYIHTYKHTYTHTHIQTYIYTHTYTYIHTHIHTYTHINAHIHTYIMWIQPTRHPYNTRCCCILLTPCFKYWMQYCSHDLHFASRGYNQIYLPHIGCSLILQFGDINFCGSHFSENSNSC